MTAQTLAPASDARERAEELLASLVAVRLDGAWTMQHDAELYELVHPALRSFKDIESAFAELVEATRLRDGLDDGTADWREVEPSLTCTEPSTAAWDIATDRVVEAVTALIGGPRNADYWPDPDAAYKAALEYDLDDMLPCPWCRAWMPSDHVCPAGAVGCETAPEGEPPCGCCRRCIAAMAADPRYGSPSDLDIPPNGDTDE